MIEEKYIQAAHDIFVQNDFWKETYEKAPTENSKNYVDLLFFASIFSSDDALKDFQESRNELMPLLSLEDLEFLCRVNGNNPGRIRFRNAMEKFGGSTKCSYCQRCICRPESYKK